MPRTAPEKPDQLARCAYEVFGERGFRDASVDEIAQRAGVTKGSFYSHYQSKSDVILAACNYYYRSYQQRVLAEVASCEDPLSKLRKMLEYSVHNCVIDKKTRCFTTEIFALALQDSSVRNGWAQFYDTVRQIYCNLVRAAQEAGQMETGNTEAAVDLMLAAIEGVKLRAVFEPAIAARSEQKTIVEGLLGILAAPCKTLKPTRITSKKR